MKTLLLTISILLLVTTTGFCDGWILYHDGPYKGKVIDAETGNPLEGAAVVAIYNVMQYFMGPDAGEVFSDVKEVVTNENGDFYIPSHTWIHLYPFAKKGTTSFLIFKPEFCVFPSPMYFKIYPESDLKVALSTMVEFFRKGMTIKLPKLKTKEKRLENLPSPVGERGDWKKQKWFIKLINEERKSLKLEEAYKTE